MQHSEDNGDDYLFHNFCKGLVRIPLPVPLTTSTPRFPCRTALFLMSNLSAVPTCSTQHLPMVVAVDDYVTSAD